MEVGKKPVHASSKLTAEKLLAALNGERFPEGADTEAHGGEMKMELVSARPRASAADEVA